MTTEVKEYTVRVRPINDGWSVEIVTSDGRFLVPARQLRRVTVKLTTLTWIFPQISTEEQQAAGDIPALCQGDDPRPIVREYCGIAASTPADQSAEAMGRYLFRLLFGAEGFERLLADAGDQSFKLLLDWSASEYLLTRLPWEMLHDGKRFLAAGNGHLIAIVRQVDTARPAASSLVAPRVLFVVGSRLKDPEVRPGAEYLGLLRRLQTLHLAIDSRVLVEATGDMLRDEIVAFRPSIVHFICHGSFIGAQGVLNLIDHESSAGDGAKFAADQLLGLLSPEQSNREKVALPAVVVLTACYSATQPRIKDDEDPVPPAVVGGSSGSLPTSDVQPLAAQLVAGGIPMVVGMGGKVADLACRLFTRMFYESLLKIDDDPVMAAARGRCNGYLFTENPSRSVDWAFPTVFVAKGGRLHRDEQQMKTATIRATAARAFAIKNDPPAFCDRFPYLRTFHELANFQAERSRIMCVYQSALGEEASQYGRSRLLQTLCMEAVRMGHFPCLISIPESDAVPTTSIVVGKAVRLAMMNTWRRFFGDRHKIAAEEFELDKLEQGRTDQLHAAVRRAIGDHGVDNPLTVVTAIQLDAAMLRDKAWKQLHPDGHSPGDMRVIVCFDDVHRFGQKLATALVTQMFDQGGFGTREQPIPVVFTFKKEPNYQGAFDALYKYVSERPPGLMAMELKPLAAPGEDPTIYSHYLLEGAWVSNGGVIDNVPLVAASDPAEVFDILHPWIKGEPANFERRNCELAAAVGVAMKFKHLTRARDDDVLAGVGAGR